jgi:hypothetical protein
VLCIRLITDFFFHLGDELSKGSVGNCSESDSLHTERNYFASYSQIEFGGPIQTIGNEALHWLLYVSHVQV